MQITIELEPQVQAAVQKQAETEGLRFEEYVEALLKRMFAAADHQSSTLEQFEQDWAAFCESLEGLPPNEDADLSRAVIYGDHD